MDILEGIIYMMWRGIAIGIIISAPMGPVGILCVQRTLKKGRKAGLYTGVGAAISDLFYCLLTGFGLSFIEEFLEKNQNIIQLLGSVVLIAFGVYLFRSNPSRQLKKPAEQRITPGRNILNGFLFTFSNPLIIFLIIGLFARFNFLLPDIRFYHYMIGFLFIFLGALMWWYFVTFFIDKVRAHFNLRSMWLVNKIIGSVIFLFAIVGIITASCGLASAAERSPLCLGGAKGFPSFGQPDSARLVIDNPTGVCRTALMPSGSRDITFEFRAASLNNTEKGSHPYVDAAGRKHKVRFPSWGIILLSGRDTIAVTLETHDDRLNETYCSPFLKVKGRHVSGDTEISAVEDKFTTGFDFFTGQNAFRLSKSGNDVTFSGGNREYQPLLKMDGLPEKIDSIGFIVSPGGKLCVENISYVSDKNSCGGQELRYQNIEALKERLARSSDFLEGIWSEFDRRLEEERFRMGGNYRLAIVKNGMDYDIVYLEGARKNPGLWTPGMIKGRLSATPFEGIYDVIWIDSSGREISDEAKAQLDGELLDISFPYGESQLRLGKTALNGR